jgi:tyrosine-specific transport protein
MEVGELINLLSVACNGGFVKTLLLAISATTIAISIFGVSLCLKDDFYTFFSKIMDRKASIAASCLCTVIPGCFIAIFVPNAFIYVLSFAGMLLVVIAIFIPIFLLGKVRQDFKF